MKKPKRMNKNRIKTLERSIAKNKKDVLLPLFLEVEGEDILFTDRLLQEIGENPEDYPTYTGEPLSHTPEGRRVSKKAPFIAEITGEEWAQDCYLHLKGYESQRIILL